MFSFAPACVNVLFCPPLTSTKSQCERQTGKFTAQSQSSRRLGCEFCWRTGVLSNDSLKRLVF